MRQKRNHPRPVLTTRRRWWSERQKQSSCMYYTNWPDGLQAGICLAMLEAEDLAVFLPDYRESTGNMIEWA